MGGVIGILNVEARDGFTESPLLRPALGIGIATAKSARRAIGHEAEHEVSHRVAGGLASKEEAAILQVADVGVVLSADDICTERYLVLPAYQVKIIGRLEGVDPYMC